MAGMCVIADRHHHCIVIASDGTGPCYELSSRERIWLEAENAIDVPFGARWGVLADRWAVQRSLR